MYNTGCHHLRLATNASSTRLQLVHDAVLPQTRGPKLCPSIRCASANLLQASESKTPLPWSDWPLSDGETPRALRTMQLLLSMPPAHSMQSYGLIMTMLTSNCGSRAYNAISLDRRTAELPKRRNSQSHPSM
eukprot:1780522-Amphidinium_carterae.1